MIQSERAAQLTAWREETVRELGQARTQLTDCQRRVQELQERLELLDKLVSLESGVPEREPPKSTALGDDLLNRCEEVIRESGRPMHISELHEALIRHGIAIPGKGTEANVIVRLHRAPDRFIRTGRGTYGLAEFGLAEVRPSRVKRRGAKR